MKEKKLSSLLTGNSNNSNSEKASDVLVGRHQGFSKVLIGGLKDTDKDKVPDRFDCQPLNPKRHGLLQKVKDTIKKGYDAVDRAAGGYLPGGSSPGSVGGGGGGGRGDSAPSSSVGGGGSGGRSGSSSSPSSSVGGGGSGGRTSSGASIPSSVSGGGGGGRGSIPTPSTTSSSGASTVQSTSSQALQSSPQQRAISQSQQKPAFTYSQLNKQYSNKIQDGKFTGSEEEYKRYVKDYENVGSYYGNTITNPQEIDKKDIFEYVKQKAEERGELVDTTSSQYKDIVNSYKSQGRTQQEAEALAQYSTRTRTSPSPEVAERYLRNEATNNLSGWRAKVYGRKGIAPESGLSKTSWVGGRVLQRAGNVAETSYTTVSKAANYVPSKVMNYFGVKEENRGFELTVGSPLGINLYGGSPVALEPRSVINQRERGLAALRNFVNTQSQRNQAPTKIVAANNSPSISQKSIQNKLLNGFISSSVDRQRTGIVMTEGETAVLAGTLLMGGASSKLISSVPKIIGAGFTAGAAGRTISGIQVARSSGTPVLQYYGQSLKENPVQTAIDTAMVGGLFYSGLSGSYRYLNKPRTSYSYFEPQKAVEDSSSVVSKPISRNAFTNEQGKSVSQTLYNFNSYSEDINIGRQTTVTNRFRQIVGRNPLYEGNPYINSKGYSSALKKLMKEGYTESQAREILRFSRPTASSTKFEGQAVVTEVDGQNPIVNFKGTEKTNYRKGFVDNVPLRQKEGIFRIIGGRSEAIKDDITRTNLEVRKAFLTPEGNPFSKVSQAGKTGETYDVMSFGKQLKDNEIYGISSQDSIIRRLNPAQRNAKLSSSKVIQIKGNPSIEVYDSTLTKDNGILKSGGSNKQQTIQTSDKLLRASIASVTKGKPATFKPTETPADIPQMVSGVKNPGQSWYEPVSGFDKRIKGTDANYLAEEGSTGFFSKSVRNTLPGVTSLSIVGIASGGSYLSGSKDVISIRQGEDSSTVQGNGFNLINPNTSRENSSQVVSLSLSQGSAQRTNQSEQPLQKESYDVVNPIITPRSPSISPPSIFPGERIPRLDIDRRKKKSEEDEKPYDSYILVDSTKGNKARWVQVADNVPRETALGIAAGIVDRSSLSSQFKIQADSGKTNNISSNAWAQIGYKFRDYMVRKGTKIQNQNRYIEKQKYRLDSSQEKSKIQQSRTSSLLIGRRLG